MTLPIFYFRKTENNRITRCFILFSFLSFFYSCSSYVQVFETNTENLKLKENDNYVYENDSIKITYNFWEDKGIMSFVIHNKLKKPLYIDWKKSSYIQNTIKINYWEDVVTTKSIGETTGISYNRRKNDGFNIKKYYVNKSVEINSSVTSKPEKTTFIPPNSNYVRTTFHILPIKELKIKDYSLIEVDKINHMYKKTKAFEKNFTKALTPLVFRNFITMSYNEDFKDEFYVDNEFYISKVIKLKKRQFEDYLYKEGSNFYEKDGYGKAIKYSPYKSTKNFYLTIRE